jgi:hypothetical protein
MEFGIFLTFLLHTPTMKHDDDDASFLDGLPFSVLQAFRDQVSQSHHYATLLILYVIDLQCNLRRVPPSQISKYWLGGYTGTQAISKGPILSESNIHWQVCSQQY